MKLGRDKSVFFGGIHETGRNNASKRFERTSARAPPAWVAILRHNTCVYVCLHIHSWKWSSLARGERARCAKLFFRLYASYGSAFQMEVLRDARKNFVISIYFAEEWQPATRLPREIHLRSNLNFKPVKFCSPRRSSRSRVSLRPEEETSGCNLLGELARTLFVPSQRWQQAWNLRDLRELPLASRGIAQRERIRKNDRWIYNARELVV